MRVNWNTARPWIGTVARLVLGVVWLWSGWSKAEDPRRFVQAVRAYDATPEWLSKAIGYGLPVLELCLGVLLVVGIAVRVSAAVSAFLFVVFLIGIIEVAAQGIKLDCGCFGGGGLTTGNTTYLLDALRDVALLAVAVYLVVWPLTQLSLEWYLARHDYVEPPSAKRMRTPQGARKYNAMLEARQKAARERTLYITSSLAVIVALICVIGIGVQSGRAKIQGDLTATNASVSNGIVFGKKAAATIDIYEDFQCPHCLDLEKEVGKALDADVRANKAQVRYHPLAFLDSASSGNRYSSRAANAAICASDVSVDAFVAFHNVLYGEDKSGKQVQPAEGSNGRSNADFISYAQQAGLKPDQVTTFTTCIQTEQHKALVQAMTEDASKKGVTGTPTVKVNGRVIEAPTLAKIEAAIAEALKTGPAPSPSKTPSPSASVSSKPSASVSAKPSSSSSASKPASPSPAG